VSRARELALIGALLCATAALFDAWALSVPGLAMLLASALAWTWVAASAHGTELQLRCGAVSAQEDERVEIAVCVRRGAVPFPVAEVTPWPGAQVIALPSDRSGATAATVRIARRGLHTVGPAQLRVSDPFGICERGRLSNTAELLVLPRISSVSASVLACLDGFGGPSTQAAQTVDALRAYRSGSPASRIHWPTVARSGVLMENTLKPEDDARILVLLDSQRAESEEALDRAVRAAASLCVHLAKRGGCMALLPGDRRATLLRADMRAWPALHARLALVQPTTGPQPVHVPPRMLTVIHVTARADAATRVSGPHYRVAPYPLAGLDVAFTVAGCAGQRTHSASQARVA
jgi:uncharacterized protein (DUF58 family)